MMESSFDYEEVGKIRGSRRFLVAGILQILLGIVCVAAGLMSGLVNWHPNYQGIELFDRLFVGVWLGVFFMVTGIAGIRRFTNPRGVPLTYLVLSILAAIAPSLGILVTVVSLFISSIGSPGNNKDLRELNFKVNGLLIVAFFLEFMTSVAASIFSCHSISTSTRDL